MINDIQYLIDNSSSWSCTRQEQIAQQPTRDGGMYFFANNTLRPYQFKIGINPVINNSDSGYAPLWADIQSLNRDTIFQMFKPRYVDPFRGMSDWTNISTPGCDVARSISGDRTLLLQNPFTINLSTLDIVPTQCTLYDVNIWVKASAPTTINLVQDNGNRIFVGSLTSQEPVIDFVQTDLLTTVFANNLIELEVQPASSLILTEIQVYYSVVFHSPKTSNYIQGNKTLFVNTLNATSSEGYLVRKGDWLQLTGCRFPVQVTNDVIFTNNNQVSIPIDRNIPPLDGYDTSVKGIMRDKNINWNVILTALPEFVSTPLTSIIDEELNLIEVVNNG